MKVLDREMKKTYKKLYNSHFCIATIVVFLAVWCCSATAAPVFFTDRAAFDTATGGGLNFEGFEAPWTDSGGVAVFADFSVSETGGINDLFHATEAGGESFSVTEGVDSVWYDDNGVSVGSFFSFDVPVMAFGLDITFTQGNGSSTSSTVAIGGSVSDSIALVESTPRFWGVIDPGAIGFVSFNAGGSGFIGFDAVSYGIPEPATICLLGLGSLVLRRKLRKCEK